MTWPDLNTAVEIRPVQQQLKEVLAE